MSASLRRIAQAVGDIEPLKAAVIGILFASYGLGVAYARLDGRIGNAAAALAEETGARKEGDRGTDDRIGRGFHEVLGRLDQLQKTADERAAADRQTAREIGLLRGLYERNYGAISDEETARP